MGNGTFTLAEAHCSMYLPLNMFLPEVSARLVTVHSNLHDRLVPLVYSSIYFLPATGWDFAVFTSDNYLPSTAIPTSRCRIKLLDSPEFCKSMNTLSTVLQIGRSLVRFQMVSLEFFIDIILPIALWPWG
jgi:hypothetical protein